MTIALSTITCSGGSKSCGVHILLTDLVLITMLNANVLIPGSGVEVQKQSIAFHCVGQGR